MHLLNESEVRGSYLTWGRVQLEDAIKRADCLYWDSQDTGIPDPLFDDLVWRLEKVAPESKVLRNVGLSEDSWGEPVTHNPPMLSLEKCKTLDGLKSWVEGHGEALRYRVTPKVDGVAISLEYDAMGRFFRASTRGNGEIGEDVTVPVRRLECIPLTVAPQGHRMEIRGELYFIKRSFLEYSDTYSNPRNAVAGYLKNRKSEVLPLGFFPYSVFSHAYAPSRVSISWLDRPFKIAGIIALDPVDTARSWSEKEESLRDSWPYEADGIVVEILDVRIFEKTGQTAHHPKGAIALKFPDQSAETKLVDVEWNTSRTGVITPVAVVNPITVGGAQVSRATLHNLGRFQELALVLGDVVRIQRRGGVIPHIEGVIERSAGRPVHTPNECPSCKGSVAERCDGDGTFLVCQSNECGAVKIQRLIHFASVVGFKGFGPKIVAKLYEDGYLCKLPDFYGTDRHFWEHSLGVPTARNLYSEVDSHTKIPLATFLCALGIEGLGAQTSKVIAEKLEFLYVVRLSNWEELSQLPGIGEDTARSIVSGLGDLRVEMNGLALYTQVPSHPRKKKGWKGPRRGLRGEVICFTGSGTRPRKDLQSLAERAGASVVSSITKQLTILVELSNEVGSSKTVRVLDLRLLGQKIRLVSELEFLSLVGAQDV